MTTDDYIQFLKNRLDYDSKWIEKLRAEVERLKKENEALRELADMVPGETVVYRG